MFPIAAQQPLALIRAPISGVLVTPEIATHLLQERQNLRGVKTGSSQALVNESWRLARLTFGFRLKQVPGRTEASKSIVDQAVQVAA